MRHYFLACSIFTTQQLLTCTLHPRRCHCAWTITYMDILTVFCGDTLVKAIFLVLLLLLPHIQSLFVLLFSLHPVVWPQGVFGGLVPPTFAKMVLEISLIWWENRCGEVVVVNLQRSRVHGQRIFIYTPNFYGHGHTPCFHPCICKNLVTLPYAQIKECKLEPTRLHKLRRNLHACTNFHHFSGALWPGRKLAKFLVGSVWKRST